MTYEPWYERFEAAGPDGVRREVGFMREGFRSLEDQPEVYFFTISGHALGQFQRGCRYLSREERGLLV